jgi:hypothetical protein
MLGESIRRFARCAIASRFDRKQAEFFGKNDLCAGLNFR